MKWWCYLVLSPLLIGHLSVAQAVENYSVQAGDTLWSISQVKHIDVQKLQTLNQITDVKKLQIGTQLVLSDEQLDREILAMLAYVKYLDGEVKPSKSLKLKKLGVDYAITQNAEQYDSIIMIGQKNVRIEVNKKKYKYDIQALYDEYYQTPEAQMNILKLVQQATNK